ncbi:hypothetical protein Y1Q_0001236 [Alligator mississippiensis]|uniref:Uncharacterized protein n=1 Tax=Alligator mississippiensis TaxID=8496 RepID=A0A151PEP1_ALLMI|nr:hypothetical protein Y1Q_0001236 [Alligator mississippiensis]
MDNLIIIFKLNAQRRRQLIGPSMEAPLVCGQIPANLLDQSHLPSPLSPAELCSLGSRSLQPWLEQNRRNSSAHHTPR